MEDFNWGPTARNPCTRSNSAAYRSSAGVPWHCIKDFHWVRGFACRDSAHLGLVALFKGIPSRFQDTVYRDPTLVPWH
jgi:hypothetical protein